MDQDTLKQAGLIMHRISLAKRRLNVFGFENFQSWETIRSFNLFEKIVLSKECLAIKIIDSENHCRFLTKMKEGASLSGHYHDIYEYVLVLKGTLTDPLNEAKVCKGDTHVIKPMIAHNPINEDKEDLWLVVDFIKSEDNATHNKYLADAKDEANNYKSFWEYEI